MRVQSEAKQANGLLDSRLIDRLAIRELLENWVLWRDAGMWDRFATVWHPGGRMNASWFQSDATEFIAGCRKAFDAGMVGMHLLGGSTIDVRGLRAVAFTKVQITQRALLDGVMVDVICDGRFADALDKRDGCWGMVWRQPIYEIDRLIVLDPAATLQLDPELLLSFPQGYRHLGYLQTKLGFDVSRVLPGTQGPEVDALYAKLDRWLDGADPSCLES